MQAADACLQKSLEQLLEDVLGKIGLKSDWKLVFDAANVIVKCQMRVDKVIVTDSLEASDEEVKDKLATLKNKLEEPVLDDLVKGIQELNLNLKAVKLEGFSSKGSTSNSRPRPLGRACMWCDRQDHERQDCDDFNEAYKKNIIFWKDNEIHLRATGEPICVNFNQGGMKKLAEEILHNVTMVDVATYGLQVISKAEEEDAKAYGELWPYALKTTKRGKVSRGKLYEARNCIHETTGWSDPIDTLSVYAYIAKSKANEAWVEEKRKRDEEGAGFSKRATRFSTKKIEVPKPSLEVNMEDASKDKKKVSLEGLSTN
ncbi:hypothetical protein L7F22_068456 [Adiantum nelumboides]|nr:hypothetical protein [Adiantum nelumboides]MCO5614175.1 hypothetical protein [Adiantum nelumboides]